MFVHAIEFFLQKGELELLSDNSRALSPHGNLLTVILVQTILCVNIRTSSFLQVYQNPEIDLMLRSTRRFADEEKEHKEE